MLTVIVSALYGLFSVIFSSIFYAIFSVFNAIWSFIKFIYQTVLVDAIWKGLIFGVVWLMILKPTGIIGCQLIVVILKGFWYGVFIKERLMADGYFQAPQESSVRQFPFEVFKPPEWLQRSIGCVFGLVFGLRGILDVLSVVVISSWYGYDPKLFSIKGSVFEEIPANVYKSGITRIFGLVFGFIVGFRCLAALLILIPVAAWKGKVLAPKAPWSLFDSETKASGNWGLIFGNLFGFAVGWRWIINWLVYSLLYVPIVLILGSFLLGAIFGALSPPQWLISRYYCPTYKMNTLADLKMLSFLQVLCFYIGAYTLGIAIGWSNWLQLFIMIPEFLARTLWYIVLGSFYGVAPLSCHFKEGPIPPPVERGEIYDTLMKQILGTIGAIAFGLFVGWRSIVNFLAFIPVASWYGPLYIRMSHPLFSADASSKTPKSITGQIMGAVFGVIIGGRNWLNVITLVLFWTGFIVKMLALGSWFGMAPVNSHNRDGYLILPSEQVYSTAESKWICPIGALLFGLIIGWRTILNFVSMIPLATWRGPFAKPYMFQGSTITRADSPVCITAAGKFFGAVFGLGMGFRFYCDLLLLIMSTALASSLGFMKNSWSFFVTSVKSIAFGIWFGSSNNVLIDEGYIKTVVVDEAEKFNAKARWIGAILGLIVGWRNIGNLVAITSKASYYGFDPIALHCNDGRFPQLTETPYKNKEITRWFSFLGFYIGWRNIFNFITIIPMCFWYGAFPREAHCADGFLPQPGISYEPPSYEEAVISDPSLRNAEANNEMASTKQEESNWAEPVKETKIDIPNINQDTGVDVLSEHIPAVYKNNAVRLLGGSIFGLGFGMRSLVNLITIIPKAMWLGLLPNVFHAGDGHLRRPDPECWKSPLAQICMGSTFGLLFGFRSLVNLASIVPAAFWYGCVGYLDIPDALEISIFGKPKYPPTGYVGRFVGLLFGGIIGFRNFLQLLFILVYFLAVCIACIVFGGYYGLISTKYALKDSSFGLIETNPFLYFTSHLTNQTQYTTVYKVSCYINFAFCYLGASTLGLIIGWRLILANLEVLLLACYNGIWNDIAFFRQYYILCSPKTYFESWEAYIYSILFGLFGFGWIFIVESVMLWLKAVFFGSKAFQPNDDGGYMRRALCWILTAGLVTAIIMPTALQNSFTSERIAYTLIPSILAGIFFVENGIGNFVSFTWWFKTLSIVFQVVISIVGSAVYLPFWILLVFLKKLYATIFHFIIHGLSLIFDVQLTKSKLKARKAIIRLAASTIMTTIITVILIVVVKASTRILLIADIISFILSFVTAAMIIRVLLPIRSYEYIDFIKVMSQVLSRAPDAYELITLEDIMFIHAQLSQSIFKVKYGLTPVYLVDKDQPFVNELGIVQFWIRDFGQKTLEERQLKQIHAKLLSGRIGLLHDTSTTGPVRTFGPMGSGSERFNFRLVNGDSALLISKDLIIEQQQEISTEPILDFVSLMNRGQSYFLSSIDKNLLHPSLDADVLISYYGMECSKRDFMNLIVTKLLSACNGQKRSHKHLKYFLALIKWNCDVLDGETLCYVAGGVLRSKAFKLSLESRAVLSLWALDAKHTETQSCYEWSFEEDVVAEEDMAVVTRTGCLNKALVSETAFKQESIHNGFKQALQTKNFRAIADLVEASNSSNFAQALCDYDCNVFTEADIVNLTEIVLSRRSSWSYLKAFMSYIILPFIDRMGDHCPGNIQNILRDYTRVYATEMFFMICSSEAEFSLTLARFDLLRIVVDTADQKCLGKILRYVSSRRSQIEGNVAGMVLVCETILKNIKHDHSSIIASISIFKSLVKVTGELELKIHTLFLQFIMKNSSLLVEHKKELLQICEKHVNSFLKQSIIQEIKKI